MSSLEGEARMAAVAGDRNSLEQRSETRDRMQIDWNVPITMDDGLVLRADVFRPLAEGRHPVILSYGPYAKGLAFQDGYPSAWQRMAERHPDVTAGSSNLYQSWEVVDPEKWVPHNYACVRVDSRGCGCSPGYIDHFSPRETKDFYDCIEWASVQPWSSGKVGLNGISYYAINQWHVASLQPPHLSAMCIWEGAADWYRDMTHHGGILCTFWENWYDMQVKTVQYGAGERGKRSRVHGELVCGPEFLSEEDLARNRSDFGAEILAHPLHDAYHKARSPIWSNTSCTARRTVGTSSPRCSCGFGTSIVSSSAPKTIGRLSVPNGRASISMPQGCLPSTNPRIKNRWFGLTPWATASPF